MVRRYTAPMPPLLPPSPSLEQVIQVVNDNSRRIYSFYTNKAALNVPGVPTLRANLAMQRPRRFRLRAESLMRGPELDVGSNDELFWFWVRQSPDPSVFYCRHDEFATSRARQMIPISPEWLIEAMGIVELDPALPHQGPFTRPDGQQFVEVAKDGGRAVRRDAADIPVAAIVDDKQVPGVVQGWPLGKLEPGGIELRFNLIGGRQHTGRHCLD
jgi:hypothetical protein